MTDLFFFAPVWNVEGESILSVGLRDGLRFRRRRTKNIMRLLDEVDTERREWLESMYFLYHAPRGGSSYMYVMEAKITKRGRWGERSYPVFRSCQRQVELLRLFKEGEIFCPGYYSYRIMGQDPMVEHSEMLPLLSRSESNRYELTLEEARDLSTFLARTDLEGAPAYIELAIRHFQSSYDQLSKGMEFLSLMISLEVLLNQSPSELRYRLSRSVAALLAQDSAEFLALARKVRDLYDLRSKLVHAGDESVLKEADVFALRSVVRRSLVKALEMGLIKDQLIQKLELAGFFL